jgi:hypothetical protein
MLKTVLASGAAERILMEKAEPECVAAPRRQIAGSNQRRESIGLALVAFLLTSMAAAQTLTGTVKDSTTGKPSVGDEVVAFTLGRGMEESGRTKTDANGRFSLKLNDPQAPVLVRAIHQGVTYHRIAPPGTTTVSLEVYDVAQRIRGIKVFADIMRIHATQGEIVVSREFAVQNTSNPPRTQMNDHNLEFYLPDGAHVSDASATSGNGNPLKSAPVPEGEKNRYSFVFPLRPGLTRFEVTYQLPYGGNADLDPKSIYPLEHFVVMLPKAMQFKPSSNPARFKLLNFPNQPNTTVQVASDATVGQNLAFNVSGEGTLESVEQSDGRGSGQGTPNAGGSTSAAQANNRPGGGLGPPIDAPDPLQKYRWWILGGAASLLLSGGIYVALRQQSGTRVLKRREGGTVSISYLMDGIREELFRVEVERTRGQISQAEYEKAKSALDRTLDRALKRETQRA